MFFNEGNEPPHVHVVHRNKSAAKFWLEPVELCFNYGFNPSQLRQIREKLRSNIEFFKEQWHATQAKKK